MYVCDLYQSQFLAQAWIRGKYQFLALQTQTGKSRVTPRPWQINRRIFSEMGRLLLQTHQKVVYSSFVIRNT